MKNRVRIQRIIIFTVAVTAIFFPRIMSPEWKVETIDQVMDALGITLVLFGFLFRISARGYKEENSLSGKNMVKDGPYAFVRNPMYLGTFLIGFGIIFVLFKIWTSLLFLSVFLLIYIPQVKKEEAALSRLFSEEYRDYRKTVPRFFPGPLQLLNIADYIILKPSWIKKEFISLVTTFILIIAIEVRNDIGLFGYQEFYKEPVELSLVILLFVAISFLLIKRGTTSIKH